MSEIEGRTSSLAARLAKLGMADPDAALVQFAVLPADFANGQEFDGGAQRVASRQPRVVQLALRDGDLRLGRAQGLAGLLELRLRHLGVALGLITQGDITLWPIVALSLRVSLTASLIALAIGAPFGDRPAVDFGRGGTLRLGQWFRGDMAPFAGVEWQATPKLTFKAEYSSDAYEFEAGERRTFDRKSPVNFGVEYAPSNGVRFGLYSLYGSEVGLSAQIVLDPKKSATGGSLGPGPLPVQARTVAKTWGPDWVTDTSAQSTMRRDLQIAVT